MATVWVYPAEILPLKIRSKGAALAAAADFLGNFLVSFYSKTHFPWISSDIVTVKKVVEITPPALENIGYKTYIIFAVFNIVAAFIVYCFYPETSYLNLESVDLIFLPDEDLDQEIEAKRNFYQKAVQWNVVPRARIAVEEAKARKKAGLAEALGDIEPDQADAKLSGPTHVEYKEWNFYGKVE